MEDNYSQWKHREARLEKRLKQRPTCVYCGHPIQDERLFDINGELYHEGCACDEFKKWTEDYE